MPCASQTRSKMWPPKRHRSLGSGRGSWASWRRPCRLRRLLTAVLPGSGSIACWRSIVGQHGMDLVGEHLDDLAQKGGAVGLGVGIKKSDLREARSPPGPAGPVPCRRRISRLLTADCEEHEELVLSLIAQFTNVDVDVTDLRQGETSAFGSGLCAFGQAREGGDLLAQVAQDVVEWQQRATTELDDDDLLGLGEDRAAWPGRSHPRISCERAPTPLGDGLQSSARSGWPGCGSLLATLGARLELAASYGLSHEDLLP